MSTNLNQSNQSKQYKKLTKKVSFNERSPEVRDNVVMPKGLSDKEKKKYYNSIRSQRQGDWVPNRFVNNSLRDIEGDLQNAPYERFPSGSLRSKLQSYNYKSSSKKMTPARLDKLRNEASYNINSMVSIFKESETNENKIIKYKENIENKKRKAMRILNVVSINGNKNDNNSNNV